MFWSEVLDYSVAVKINKRVTAEVVGVDTVTGRMLLSSAENPELWAFSKGLRVGDVLGGV